VINHGCCVAYFIYGCIVYIITSLDLNTVNMLVSLRVWCRWKQKFQFPIHINTLNWLVILLSSLNYNFCSLFN